ncbi:MAG: kelch motif-containing protein [Desulfobulbaceae bacterium]|nr:kelch motif-containing protein [Desulfobulbaceae bacterium]
MLVAGESDGNALATAELYDPVFNSWTVIEDALAAARYDHTATLLADGRVLFAGGSNGGYLDSVELYNPAEETWSYSAGILDTARSGHTATLPVGGKVMIAGGGKALRGISAAQNCMILPMEPA